MMSKYNDVAWVTWQKQEHGQKANKDDEVDKEKRLPASILRLCGHHILTIAGISVDCLRAFKRPLCKHLNVALAGILKSHGGILKDFRGHS